MFYHIIMKNFKSNLKNYILFFVSNILAIAELFAFWGLNDVVKKAVKDGVTAATLKSDFLRCMGMKQKQRRKTIRFETQMLSDIALFATVMMGIVYVLSYEWRCASKDAGSLDVTFWMYWILIVGIYLLADRLVQWLFAQYVIKRVEKGND